MRPTSLTILCSSALLLAFAAGPAAAHPNTPQPLPADRVDPADVNLVEDQLRNLRGLHRYDEAERLARRSLTEVRAQFGAGEQLVIAYRHLLVTLRTTNRGAVEERKQLAREALALNETVYGVGDLRTANALSQLGAALYDGGELDASFEARERSLAIKERSHGADSPEVALGLLHVAWPLREAGRTDDARAALDRALAILRAAPQAKPGWLEQCLRLRGTLYRENGDYASAARALEEARELAAGLDPSDKRYGLPLIELAQVEAAAGNYVEARGLSAEALAHQELAYGEDDACLMRVLPEHARITFRSGDAAAAEALYERGLRLLASEELYDFWQWRVPLLKDGLARVQWNRGRRAPALATALEAERLSRERFIVLAQGLAEREALLLDQLRGSSLDTALSILAALPRGESGSGLIGDVWDEVVRSRAIVLDEIASRQRSVTRSTGGELAESATALQSARERLARLVQLRESPGSGDEAIRQAMRLRDQAEAAMARLSHDARGQLAARRAGLAQVVEALPTGSALVAYVHFERIDRSSAQPVETFYLAFVARSGSRELEFVPLGRGTAIDALVQDWRRLVGTAPKPGDDDSLSQAREAGSRLRSMAWDSISPLLKGVDTVFVVPDGSLHLVNLATLPVDGDRFLIETGPLLHHLSAERDVVRFSSGIDEPAGGLLAMGGPDFDARPGSTGAEAKPDEASAYRSVTPDCPSFTSLSFANLPAAQGEVESIAAVWNRDAGDGRNGNVPTKLTGGQASEALFKRLAPQHGVLHVATHGYFVPDRCESIRDVERLASNPLLYSGLALAGANHPLENGRDGDDGILTAEEIASLDLSKVDWAVLSACETGVGDLRSGEGVLGLRRAFEVAGADTLIMSLWKVEDDATSVWMDGLYRARLGGASTAESVRQAGRAVLELLRGLEREPHPFYWGAFVAAGDWR